MLSWIIQQQFDYATWNGYILRDIQPYKTKSWRDRKHE